LASPILKKSDAPATPFVQLETASPNHILSANGGWRRGFL
jgi:hypothetical protein